MLAIVIVAVAVVALVWPREKDPEPAEAECNGKKLSDWIALYSSSQGGRVTARQGEEAAAAVRSIGTNAIPHLIRWLDHSPAQGTRVVDAMLGGLRETFRSSNTMETAVERADRLATWGVVGFRILGKDAAIAIPQLGKRLMTNSPGAAGVAVAMSWIGKEALPPLLHAMTDGPPSNRHHVASCIGSMRRLGSDAAVAVPVLVRFAGDDNEATAKAAIVALGKLHLEPELALPSLRSALRDHRPKVRDAAATAIGSFKQSARKVLPALLAACDDPDPYVRHDVTNALSKIAPELGFKQSFRGADGPPTAGGSESDAAARYEATNELLRIAPEVLTNGVSGP